MLDITSQLATHTLLQLHMTSIHAKILSLMVIAGTSLSYSYSTSLVFDFRCTGNELQLSDCSYRLVNSYTSPSSCSPVFTVSCAQCKCSELST